MALVARLAVLLVLAAGLSGCLTSPSPVLEVATSDPLPGGPGRFEGSGETDGEAIAITIRKAASAGHAYVVVGLENGKKTAFEALIKRVAGNRYIVQVAEDDDRKGYLLTGLEITEDRIKLLTIDGDELAAIARRNGLTVARKRLFGDNSEAERLIEAAVAAGRPVLVQNIAGATIRADRATALKIATEMARSDKAKAADRALVRVRR